MASSSPSRLFLLSPAFVGGARAQFLLNPRAQFPLARQFHAEGLPLSDVFAFTSGLYFRGKITYACAFARSEPDDFVRIITSNAGLVTPATVVRPWDLIAFGATEIDAGDPAYHEPLRRDAKVLAKKIGGTGTALLLGSIATPKYRAVLLEVFGPRLFFPSDFVGRGDMSRGALLLRAARDGQELDYTSVQGAILTGKRAARVPVLRKN